MVRVRVMVQVRVRVMVMVKVAVRLLHSRQKATEMFFSLHFRNNCVYLHR